MIVVSVSITSAGQIVFRFCPEPTHWILHGSSLSRIEEAIRQDINAVMPDPALDPDTATRITACAQSTIDALVEGGVIEEG